MTCIGVALFTLVVAGASPRAHAQTPSKVAGTSASVDTIVISSFDLYDGATAVAGQPVTLNHRLAGRLAPSHFRVSRFVDFRDATWQVYVQPAPRWSSPSFDGTCGNPAVARLVAYLQVRAPRATAQGSTTFVMSNVARDTACVMIGA
ncbi:MAG: hypothetical protein ABJE10_21595 [bacterium]